jgi:hypothetical protein
MYNALSLAKEALKANAASVPSTRGGGNNGYLGLVLSPAAYATVKATAFDIPNFPGAQPANLGGSAAVIQEAVRQHAEDLCKWHEYVNVNQALKKQLIHAVEPIYLRALKNRNVGYNNRSLHTMLQFFFDNYGNITPMDLKANNDLINTAWDPNTPFELLIDQIETCSDVAEAGSQPFTAAQILNTAYTLVYNTGFFFNDCKTWNRKPAANKTWDAFKVHFFEAHMQHRLQAHTTQQAGFHGANGAWPSFPFEETVEALTNLATSTQNNRQALATLTFTIHHRQSQHSAQAASAGHPASM